MQTAIIYARYSSDKQTEQSIEGQLRVCQQYAKQNDYLILDTYIDRAMTGTNDNRAGFQKMLHDSNKKQWNAVIVYKLDRFSRNKYESAIHKRQLRDNGVKLISAMENIPDTPEGIILESLLEGMNEYYSAELSQKIKRGLTESRMKGQCTGGIPPFGYKIIDKKCVLDEEKAPIVVEIFTKYAQGYTAKVLAEDLYNRGIRLNNGGIIKQAYIYKILSNSKYNGIVQYGNRTFDNIFPKIVPDDIWEKVKAIQEENLIGPGHKKDIFDFILSGKLICGNCKHKMQGASGTSHTGNIYYYYRCVSKNKNKTKCNLKVAKKQFLEDLVIDTTTKIINDDSLISKIAEKVYAVHKKEVENSSTLKNLENQRTSAIKASGNLIKCLEQGIVTEQTKTRLKELEEVIFKLDFDIDQEKQRSYTYLTVDMVKDYLQNVIKTDNINDINYRKLLVRSFIREIVLYDDKILITYHFTENNNPTKVTFETAEEIEKQSIKNDSAFSFMIDDNKYFVSLNYFGILKAAKQYKY